VEDFPGWVGRDILNWLDLTIDPGEFRERNVNTVYLDNES